VGQLLWRHSGSIGNGARADWRTAGLGLRGALPSKNLSFAHTSEMPHLVLGKNLRWTGRKDGGAR
jgi:hypothetical protein